MNKGFLQYKPLIQKYAKEYGLNPAYFAALIQQESGFNPNARSKVGAMGMGQLMPGTAKGLGVTNPWDPEQNIRGSAKYLSQNLKRFGGNYDHTLAAYNAGPGAVQKYHGIPPYRETQHYVKTINNNRKRYESLFGPVAPPQPAQAMGQLGQLMDIPRPNAPQQVAGFIPPQPQQVAQQPEMQRTQSLIDGTWYDPAQGQQLLAQYFNTKKGTS